MPTIREIRSIRTIRRSGATTTNLAKRRTWFAESDPAGEQQNNQQGGSESKYDPKTVEDAMKIITALEKRVGEREATIETQKASLTSLNDRIAAIEAASRKKLEEQGNFSELKTQLQAEIETLKPLKDRAEALEKIIRESNEARIKNVPEQFRAMVPVDYPPERLQAWLNANEAQLVKPPPPDFDAGKGAGGNGGGKRDEIKVTDADKRQAETAQSLGHKITAEDIAKRRAGITTTVSNDKKE